MEKEKREVRCESDAAPPLYLGRLAQDSHCFALKWEGEPDDDPKARRPAFSVYLGSPSEGEEIRARFIL